MRSEAEDDSNTSGDVADDGVKEVTDSGAGNEEDTMEDTNGMPSEPVAEVIEQEPVPLPRTALKSAKGIEGPAIESPAVDIFGNPEHEEAW